MLIRRPITSFSFLICCSCATAVFSALRDRNTEGQAMQPTRRSAHYRFHYENTFIESHARPRQRRLSSTSLDGTHAHEHFDSNSEFFVAGLQTPATLVRCHLADVRSGCSHSRLPADTSIRFGHSHLRCRGSVDGGIRHLRQLHGVVLLSEMPSRILSCVLVSQSAGGPLRAFGVSEVERF